MDQEDLDRLWRDPHSWRYGVVYYNPSDPRVLVPKRWFVWGGWTINFAHPRATLAMLTAIVLGLGPVLTAYLMFRNPVAVFAGVVVSVVLLVAWAHQKASTW